MGVHKVHDVDCHVGDLSPEIVKAFINVPLFENDPEGLDEYIAYISEAVCDSLHPHGVYKLFNPSVCRLPPKYVTPAIKLVGTLAVLQGHEVYERMSQASHTAMLVSTIGSNSHIEALHDHICKTEEDEIVFKACLEAMTSVVADKMYEVIREDAHERGYHTDACLETGSEGFPKNMNSVVTFFTNADMRLGVTADKEGNLNTDWCTVGVMGFYDTTKKKRRGCAYCHNMKTCTIRQIGMTCHGRRTLPKVRNKPVIVDEEAVVAEK